MQKNNLSNQIPIIRFLDKHKWRIIIPMLFATFYFALPRYLANYTAVQQNVFYKSSVLNKAEMRDEFLKIREQILSDDNLKNFIFKYDLYKTERESNVAENSLMRNLKNSIEIRIDDEANNQSAFIWIHFRKENAQNIAALSNEVINLFESNPNIHIDKYITEPYDSSPYKNYVFFGGLLQGLIMIVIPLILIWEIPNLFYTRKTREMVFIPLESDWQNELLDAKLRKQPWKAIKINFYYTYAFFAAMWQKSPIGDLIEFISKLAK